MDSSQNADHDSLKGWLARAALAVGLAVGFTLLMGATAWSAPRAAPYSADELARVETPLEAKVRAIRDQEIQQLRVTLGRRLEANRRADLYLRLAELYLEAYRSTFILEGRAHDHRLEQSLPDQAIDRSRSRPFLSQGIRASLDVVNLRIPYASLDRIYYFLGFNYGELGNEKESLRWFTMLTRKFPQSPLALEAFRELGDADFAGGRYRPAMAHYEQALRAGKLGDSSARTLHKLAWCHYRVKQFDRAITTMKQAIESTQGRENLLVVREEALRDLAVFMTETGQVDEAVAYFQKVAGDKSYYGRALEKLGRQYERNVEPQKATQVYESLLRTTSPGDEASFRTRVKLVDLDLRRGRFAEARDRLQGVAIPVQGEAETLTAAQNLRAMIRRTATEHHETFRKQGSKTALGVAEMYYELYLSSVLKASDPRHETPEIQMYLADVKRELGKSKEASDLYRRVIESQDQRYAKEAGALWTASLAEAMRKAGGKTRTGDHASEVELEFVRAADDLQDSLGETAEGREAALRAAQVLAAYPGSQKDAMKRAQRIIDRAPRTTQGLAAARLWLQLTGDRVATKQADSDDLADVVHDLRGNATLMAADAEVGGGRLKATLADYDSRMRVGAIAEKEKDKDFGAAAKGYEAFAAEQTRRDLAEKAYQNAVGSYVKAGDFESADRAAGAWYKRYPDSKQLLESVRSTATAALIQGRFEQAGSLFEKLGGGGRDAESLRTAAAIFEGFGNAVRARAIWARFLQVYRTHPARGAVNLSLARSFEADRDDSNAARNYKACMAADPALEAECGARLADLYVRAQDPDSARATYRKVAAMGSANKGAASPYVSYARFRLAEGAEREKSFEPLRLPEAELQKGVNQRLEFLEPLSRAYMAAVESGGPWGVAALDRLAAFAYGFADEIDRIPPPAGAKADAIGAFRKNLAAVSGPLRGKALQTWNDAYRKAVAGEILSPVIPEIADRLAEAGVAGVARAQGARGRFRLAGVPADGGDAGRDEALERTRDRLTRNALDAAAWVDYGNLLWGQGKPGLAKITYERALGIDRKLASAINNRGVIAASGSGEEDWVRAAEAMELFTAALRQDEFFLPAKANKAALLNYYRLFGRSRALWQQILAKTPLADAHDGLAVAQAGLGQWSAAEAAFVRATGAGAAKGRFTRIFHEAARAGQSAAGADACLARLGDLEENGLSGFERQSFDNLKGTCTAWKKAKALK